MSDSKPSPTKRALPSWMSSRQDTGKSPADKHAGYDENDDDGPAPGTNNDVASFSKLMEGVVFVLSGFVNPERGNLRTKALEMGAEYQQDWSSNCTLLVCAFPNTPKFRQVEADNGTIVSKDWISECYSQRKLVDIEVYLMHVGKPWRSSSPSVKAVQDKTLSSKSPHKKVEKGSSSRKLSSSVASKKGDLHLAEEFPSPAKVKGWVSNDLNRTISWLRSQAEKPEENEIKQIAAQGIITCLQDAIDALEQNQEVKSICDQWNILPQAVEELIGLEGSKNRPSSMTDENTRKWALNCKQIYEDSYKSLGDKSSEGNPKAERKRASLRDEAEISKCAAEYDSDETIEMTEEEIDDAFSKVASKVPKFSR